MAAKVRPYVLHPVACPKPNLLLLTPRRTIACHVDRSSNPDPTPTPQETGEAPRRFSSAKLSRWSRARALRSGRRLDRKKKPVVAEEQPPSQTLLASTLAEELPLDSSSSDEEDVGREEGLKAIYMVSDGTGWTLENAIEDEDRLLDIVKQAAKEGALLLFTLSDPSMAEPAKQACRLWGVPYVDVLGPTTEGIASHLRVPPLGIPRSERKSPLTEEYFRRIEAVDFTIKQDDGAQPQNLNRAHIVLVGVSRTGKTPLSIYLAQKGYKVANVPIVMGVDLPKYLFEINQEKIFGLTINQVVLHTIRKARAKTLGFPEEKGSNYSDMDHVKKELQFASRIYAQNPRWPVIEVTGKAIEETAAVVLRNYHDRKKKCSMPGISKRY